MENQTHENVSVLQYQWKGEEGEVKLAPSGTFKRNNIPFAFMNFFPRWNLNGSNWIHRGRLWSLHFWWQITRLTCVMHSPRSLCHSGKSELVPEQVINTNKRRMNCTASLQLPKMIAISLQRAIINNTELMWFLATDWVVYSQSCADEVDFRPV